MLLLVRSRLKSVRLQCLQVTSLKRLIISPSIRPSIHPLVTPPFVHTHTVPFYLFSLSSLWRCNFSGVREMSKLILAVRRSMANEGGIFLCWRRRSSHRSLPLPQSSRRRLTSSSGNLSQYYTAKWTLCIIYGIWLHRTDAGNTHAADNNGPFLNTEQYNIDKAQYTRTAWYAIKRGQCNAVEFERVRINK